MHALSMNVKVFPAAFPVAPSEQVVPVTTHAVFRCQPMCHTASITTVWRVNDTSLNTLENSQYITATNYGTQSDGSSRISALNVTGLSEYNSTTIECVAFFLDDSSSPPQSSQPANLWIQGRF